VHKFIDSDPEIRDGMLVTKCIQVLQENISAFISFENIVLKVIIKSSF